MDSNLEVGVVIERESTSPIGRVLAQEPSARSHVEPRNIRRSRRIQVGEQRHAEPSHSPDHAPSSHRTARSRAAEVVGYAGPQSRPRAVSTERSACLLSGLDQSLDRERCFPDHVFVAFGFVLDAMSNVIIQQLDRHLLERV
jgi:hypothetical protein